eukprot:6183684-Pleurochrysis_carterae.AAC.1
MFLVYVSVADDLKILSTIEGLLNVEAGYLFSLGAVLLLAGAWMRAATLACVACSCSSHNGPMQPDVHAGVPQRRLVYSKMLM